MSWRQRTHRETPVAVSITLTSLATSATGLVGRQSAVVSLATLEYPDDIRIRGEFKIGASAPTANTKAEFFLVSSENGTAWPDTFTEVNEDRTITSAEVKNGICRPVYGQVLTADANKVYEFGNIVIGRSTGFILPLEFVLFVTHNGGSGVTFSSTGADHVIEVTPMWPELFRPE